MSKNGILPHCSQHAMLPSLNLDETSGKAHKQLCISGKGRPVRLVSDTNVTSDFSRNLTGPSCFGRIQSDATDLRLHRLWQHKGELVSFHQVALGQPANQHQCLLCYGSSLNLDDTRQLRKRQKVAVLWSLRPTNVSMVINVCVFPDRTWSVFIQSSEADRHLSETILGTFQQLLATLQFVAMAKSSRSFSFIILHIL